ncbi:MAG: hypothetical protein EHM12_02305 [Dehalococcoidia bacterium]|nr:MAG: hypothetical protein EHM12_02305 [Dehalococcoidia bacterium]
MSHHKYIKFLILITFILAIILPACSTSAPQGITYDPAKKYAAFAVVNLPASASILDTAKRESAADGFEIGPIEYYNSQTTNFDPIVQKLTASKQITVIWVMGGLMDVPAIRKSAAKFGYAGGFRFMPVSGQSVPGQ